MIGKQHIVWDATDIVKGMTSGPNVSDGGFSNETNAVNLIYEPGVLNGVPAMVDKSTNLTGEAIGWTPNGFPTGGAYPNGFLIATDGKVMGVDSGQALTASSALSGTYNFGTTEIQQWLTKIFITSTDNVAIMDTDLTNGNASWWSSTISGASTLNTAVRHPLLVFQNLMWIGDANKLHNVIDTATGNVAALSFKSSLEITALGTDPSSGNMLIGTSQAPNINGTRSAGNFIYTYSGTGSVTNEYPVDGLVTGFHTNEGVTYVTYGQNYGYWNGSGVTFLRRLKNVTLTSSDLAYKHHMANIGSTNYIVDGSQILAHGEVLPGGKVFYYALDNQISSNKFSLVCPVGDNKIGVAFSSHKFYSFDTVGTGVGSLNTLKSLRYSFPNPAFVRSVSLEYAGAGVSNGDTTRTLAYRTQATASSSTNMMSLDNTSGGVIWENNDISGIADTENPCRWIQFIFTSVLTAGLRRMVVYYDPAE